MQPDAVVARRLKLRDLALLQAIAEHGSLSKVAAALAITQPAISKSIAVMEGLLGVPVLDRSPRGVSLTEYGRILLQSGSLALEELQAGVRALRGAADPEAGLVRVGTTEPMADLVASIVERMSRRYPRMGFEVMVSDTDTLLAALRRRTLDVIITRWTRDNEAPDLAIEPLFSAQLAVVAARSHPLVRRRRIELAALMDEAWTLSPPGSFLGRLVGLGFAAHGLPLPVARLVTVSIYMRLCLVAGGRFLTVLPMQILHHPTNRPWLRALDVDLGATAGGIGLITLRHHHVPGAVRLFAAASAQVGEETAANLRRGRQG